MNHPLLKMGDGTAGIWNLFSSEKALFNQSTNVNEKVLLEAFNGLIIVLTQFSESRLVYC